MNRYRILRIRPAVLLGLMVAFRDTATRDALSISGMPEDATLLRTAYDPVADWLLLFVHSETFNEVLDGAVAPYLMPVFSKEY